MGGIVHLGIKLNNNIKIEGKNKIQSKSVWTNPISSFLKDKKFFKEDKNHLYNYLKYAEEDVIFAPLDYGSIVIDYDNKVILSMQDYSYLFFNSDDIMRKEEIEYLGYDNLYYLTESEFRKTDVYDIENCYVDVTYIIKEKGVPLKNYADNIEDFSTKAKDDYKALSGSKLQDVRDKVRKWIYPDMNGWLYFSYENSNDGSRAMLDKIEELGFNLSDEEKKLWNSWKG